MRGLSCVVYKYVTILADILLGVSEKLKVMGIDHTESQTVSKLRGINNKIRHAFVIVKSVSKILVLSMIRSIHMKQKLNNQGKLEA